MTSALAQPTQSKSQQEEKKSGIDAAHTTVSKSVGAPARWLDSFFGDEDVDIESNKSQIRLKLGGFVEEGRGIREVVKVKAKLVLPKTGERLNLLVGGEADDESELENTSKDDVRERITETDKENVGIGVQYFLHRSERNNLSTAAGVRLSGSSPIGVFSGRYRHSLPLNAWVARYVQRIQWLTDNELSVPSRVEFERLISENLLFTTSLGGIWFENEDGYFYGAGISVRERIDADKAISYEWSNQFRTEPNNRLEEISLRARYRQSLWREWLKFDLIPQISFPRERDFDPTPGIYAGIEIRFGG